MSIRKNKRGDWSMKTEEENALIKEAKDIIEKYDIKAGNHFSGVKSRAEADDDIKNSSLGINGEMGIFVTKINGKRIEATLQYDHEGWGLVIED